ncbi:biotin--[acetyl-CoA-carboxylase] ligase [Ramlibacter algicola]|uniref:biotin--[biotin carboxyl-carrier protein] ligase n=1 Tax=Ramlibacter algicola TaxID=2795217 RepID=A0A934UQ02_9BURK|nr:biotin--[acetyl-CoA-carboxylase] ligase [Ramlibacter algicola]MBK0391301.1 biotin--[acetyl-CoA-carboxylase] ligase [Ramlibacter algicola]
MRWPAEAVWEQVAPALPGFTVEVLPELDSTNSELMRRARDGLFDPVLLVAEHQTAGRGRAGRPWQSRPGASLTFSLGLLLRPRDWSGLSLAAGVAIAEALHPDIQLKWPNDLWLAGDRKLGGILIETASTPLDARYAIVGVGLNVAPPAGDGLSTPPAGLQGIAPGLDAGQALLAVAPLLVQALRLFEHEGFVPFASRFAQRDILAGRAVRLTDGTEGTAAGVDRAGALVVHTAAGPVAVTSSEVSVRPA